MGHLHIGIYVELVPNATEKKKISLVLTLEKNAIQAYF
jgi:hypothetical protein